MPEVEYKTSMSLPPEVIWDFVKDMSNWAPFLTGYQKHVVESETDSVWTLKGDVGVLQRSVDLRAHVTEWNGPARVSFTLTGLNEMVEGDGTLSISKAEAASSLATPQPAKRGLFRRLLDWLFRKIFRRMHGDAPKRLRSGAAVSELKFRLRMDAGGPMAPMINAMLGPALLPAAEDLANKIAAHLEQGRG